MTNYADMTLIEVTKLPGVHDLPLKVRAPFARALIAESKGERAEAESQLTIAVQAEEAANT